MALDYLLHNRNVSPDRSEGHNSDTHMSAALRGQSPCWSPGFPGVRDKMAATREGAEDREVDIGQRICEHDRAGGVKSKRLSSGTVTIVNMVPWLIRYYILEKYRVNVKRFHHKTAMSSKWDFTIPPPGSTILSVN